MGAAVLLASTILTVTAGPMILAGPDCLCGEYMVIPSRKPPNGYFSFTSASPICVSGQFMAEKGFRHVIGAGRTSQLENTRRRCSEAADAMVYYM